MNTYTAHHLNPLTQTEDSKSFLADSDCTAIALSVERFKGLRALERDGEIIWSHQRSLYASWITQSPESLSQLAGRLSLLSRQVQAARQEGFEIKAPTSSGWILMERAS